MDRINSSSAGSFPINQALRAYAQSPKLNRPGGARFANSIQPMRPVATRQPDQPASAIEPMVRVSAADQISQTARLSQSRRTDAIGKIAPKKSALNSSSISQLVGAKVAPIDLVNDVTRIAGPRPMVTSAGTYNMYPQAADRMQAATNLAQNASVGRSLDLRG